MSNFKKGNVGNFVEAEQIVVDLNKGGLGNPVCSSFVQVRGSAPIYWFQETKVVTPKPPIHGKNLNSVRITKLFQLIHLRIYILKQQGNILQICIPYMAPLFLL